MDRTTQLHYHIHWSGKAGLDWECFSSRAEAETGASQLVRPGEAYMIEEYGPECPRCDVALNLKTSHDEPAETPRLKYGWQQAVADAFTEKRPDFVPGKVNAAQRSIAARLRDATPADFDERIAIRDALQNLRALIPEPKNEFENHDSGRKKATA